MTMDPKAIEQTEFSTSFRGYDKPAVRMFLRRVAGELDGLQGELRRRAIAAADAAAVSRAEQDGQGAETSEVDVDVAAEHSDDAPVEAVDEAELFAGFDRRKPASNPEDDVRFQALGDRIADLLKSAHESAAHLSDAAQADAEEKIGAAQAEAAVILGAAEEEAQKIRDAAHVEAVQIKSSSQFEADELQSVAQAATAEAEALRAQASEAGAEDLRIKQEELETLSAAAASDRDSAMSALADARGQVTELLGQARSQSEFIRHEAEEVIRSRVRRNMDQAEERLNVLRNSEMASRERIVAAHRELEGAMARLDVEASPLLPSDPGQYALDGAQRRADASNYGEIEADYSDADKATDADHGDALQGSAATVEPTLISNVGAIAPGDEALTELDGAASNAQGLTADTELIEAEVIETEAIETDAIEVDAVEVDAVEAEPTQVEAVEADVIDVSRIVTQGSDAAAIPAQDLDLPDEDLAPANSLPDEDALGRLVREAMERAVDSARSSEG